MYSCWVTVYWVCERCWRFWVVYTRVSCCLVLWVGHDVRYGCPLWLSLDFVLSWRAQTTRVWTLAVKCNLRSRRLWGHFNGTNSRLTSATEEATPAFQSRLDTWTYVERRTMDGINTVHVATIMLQLDPYGTRPPCGPIWGNIILSDSAYEYQLMQSIHYAAQGNRTVRSTLIWWTYGASLLSGDYFRYWCYMFVFYAPYLVLHDQRRLLQFLM